MLLLFSTYLISKLSILLIYFLILFDILVLDKSILILISISASTSDLKLYTVFKIRRSVIVKLSEPMCPKLCQLFVLKFV